MNKVSLIILLLGLVPITGLAQDKSDPWKQLTNRVGNISRLGQRCEAF